MAVDANAVADCVLASFDQLEDKRKPRPRNDGTREWVPLAGIVLSKGMPCRIREVQKWLTLQGLVKTASFLASPWGKLIPFLAIGRYIHDLVISAQAICAHAYSVRTTVSMALDRDTRTALCESTAA
jgi:hypothetical protein